VENNHPAIISQETFNRANEILNSRKWSTKDRKPKEHHALAGKIFCGHCGTTYGRRGTTGGAHRPFVWRWECGRYASSGKAACPDSFTFKESELIELFLSAYNEAVDGGFAESKDSRLSDALKELLAEERELSTLRAKGYIMRADFESEQVKLIAEIKRIESELTARTKKAGGKMNKANEYDGALVRFLDKARIFGLEITFYFNNGAEIKRRFCTNRRNLNGRIIKDDK